MKADIVVLFEDYESIEPNYSKDIKETIDSLGRVYIRYNNGRILVVKNSSFLSNGEMLSCNSKKVAKIIGKEV